MELGKKIQQVLRHSPLVFVKGLGVFSRIHQSATYDEKHSVFFPPLDYIEFDPESTEGYSLIQFIQEERNISHTEAEKFVEEEIDHILNQILEYGQANIDQLGQLVRHGEGFVFRSVDLAPFSFAPINNSNPGFRPESSQPEEILSVGEEAVIENEADIVGHAVDSDGTTLEEKIDPSVDTDSDDVVEVIDEEIIIDVQEKNDLLVESVDSDKVFFVEEEAEEQISKVTEVNILEKEVESHSVETSEPVVDVQNQEIEPERKTTIIDSKPFLEESKPIDKQSSTEFLHVEIEEVKSSNTFWYILSGVVAACIIGVVWYVNHPIGLGNKDKKSIAPTIIADSSNVESVTAHGDTLATEEPEQEEVPIISEPIVENSKSDQILPAGHQWYIVIGSRMSKDGADSFIDKFVKDGFKHVRILPGSTNRGHTVIWDSYKTREELDSALRYVHKNHIKDAWPAQLSNTVND